MQLRTLITLLFVGLSASQLLAAADGPPDKREGLLNRSPFGGAAPGSSTAILVDQPLEFRGVLEERGVKIFSIYNTITRRSTWFDLNRRADDISIEAYDDVQELITVAHQGKSLVLPLKGAVKKARTVEAALSKTAKVQEPNEYHDKPFRLGHVLEETLIRRAIRRPAATPANSPAPPTTAISR